MDRRTVLRAGLAVSTVGVAGCGGFGRDDQVETPTREPVTNGLQVLDVFGLLGTVDSESIDEIGAVALVLTKAAGADDIEVRDVELQWVDDTGTYDLVHESVYDGRVDGAFTHRTLAEETISLAAAGDSPVIKSSDDRVALIIDVGRSESAAGSGNIADTAYERTLTDEQVIKSRPLVEGEEASVRITTQSGAVSTANVYLPEIIDGTFRTAVRL